MRVAEPAQVLANRRKIEGKMFEKYQATAEDVAEYFQIPLPVIATDMKRLGIERASGDKPFNLAALEKKRDREITRRIKSGESKVAVLESLGYWRMPTKELKMLASEDLLAVTPENKAAVLKAAKLVEIGFNIESAVKHIGGLDTKGRSSIKAALENSGAKGGHSVLDSDSEAKDYAREAILNAAKAVPEGQQLRVTAMLKLLRETTGISKSVLAEECNGGAFEVGQYYAEANDGKAARSAERKAARAKLRQEVYESWTSGAETQSEIAKRYGVTRHTIMNLIQEEKFARADELKENVPTVRRRNLGEAARDRKAVAVAKVTRASEKLKESGLPVSIAAISRETGLSESQASLLMKEESLVTSAYDRCELLTLREASRLGAAAESKGFLASLGYGPNAGVTKLQDAEANKVHRLQRETSIALRVEEGFRESFRASGGSVEEFYLPRNKRAQAQLAKGAEEEGPCLSL